MTDAPPRPTSAAVAAALVQAAEGEPLLANAPGSAIPWGLQTIDTLSRWQLCVWWRDGHMGPLHSAIDPAGLQWVYGCARWPDWLAGPEAVVLDPIRHLLTDEQRQGLHAALLDAVCWPAPDLPPEPEPPPLRPLTDEELLDLIPS